MHCSARTRRSPHIARRCRGGEVHLRAFQARAPARRCRSTVESRHHAPDPPRGDRVTRASCTTRAGTCRWKPPLSPCVRGDPGRDRPGRHGRDRQASIAGHGLAEDGLRTRCGEPLQGMIHARSCAPAIPSCRRATKNPPLGGFPVRPEHGMSRWNWQPRMDSNHRMPESESGALPLGDGAVVLQVGDCNAKSTKQEYQSHSIRDREQAPGPERSDQRFENWVARRALCRPTFLRSTSRASRVMKPALRSSDFRVSSYSTSARAMPRRIAPA